MAIELKRNTELTKILENYIINGHFNTSKDEKLVKLAIIKSDMTQEQFNKIKDSHNDYQRITAIEKRIDFCCLDSIDNIHSNDLRRNEEYNYQIKIGLQKKLYPKAIVDSAKKLSSLKYAIMHISKIYDNGVREFNPRVLCNSDGKEISNYIKTKLLTKKDIMTADKIYKSRNTRYMDFNTCLNMSDKKDSLYKDILNRIQTPKEQQLVKKIQKMFINLSALEELFKNRQRYPYCPQGILKRCIERKDDYVTKKDVENALEYHKIKNEFPEKNVPEIYIKQKLSLSDKINLLLT